MPDVQATIAEVREQMTPSERIDALLAKAVAEDKMKPESVPGWRREFERQPGNTEAELARLQPVPGINEGTFDSEGAAAGYIALHFPWAVPAEGEAE